MDYAREAVEPARYSPNTLRGKDATVTARLMNKRVQLKDELDRVDAALAALKANPAVEEVMNLVQQASY